jgi:hypothetical protein
MNSWKIVTPFLAAWAGALGLGLTDAEEKPKAAAPGTLMVRDAAGKEQTLKAWKFAVGTRRLTWLAPASAEKEPLQEKAPPAKGPEALEFVHATEIKYLPTVLTLIPLDRIRAIDFDNEKEIMTVRVATAPGTEKDEVLSGAAKYRKLNKLILEAEVDKGEQGVAEVKFQGGLPKGIQAIRFPPPRLEAAPPAGRPAVVITADGAKKTTHQVSDLQPLYRLAGGTERLAPTLMFKKTLKLDVAKIRKIAVSGEADDLTWHVSTKDGEEQTLTLLEKMPLDNKPAQLEGLLGRVPVGFKLFPAATVAEVKFGTASVDSSQ